MAGNAGMIISPNRFTLADAFKQKGYATAAIGKWHLGLGSNTGAQDWNSTLDQSLDSIGFDYTYIMAATADRVPCVFIENNKVANYDSQSPIFVDYQRNFDGEPTGLTHPELLTKQRSSHGHNQSIVNGIGRIGYMKGGGKALWRDEDIADSITTHAIQFIKTNKDSPFFLSFCTNDIHVPRQPHERFRGKSKMGLRGEAIIQFDETVGRICQTLEELNLSQNTLIIITSDNGPVLDDGYEDGAIENVGTHLPGGPFRGGKYSNYEAGSIVPFIVAGPSVCAEAISTTNDCLISHIDFVSSLSAFIIKADLPDNCACDSENHISSWLGIPHSPSRYAALKMAHTHNVSIRTKDWKYIPPSQGPKLVQWGPKIETGSSTSPGLYLMRNDNSEQINKSNQYPTIVKEMYNLLLKMVNGK